jgi:hypothetical protein
LEHLRANKDDQSLGTVPADGHHQGARALDHFDGLRIEETVVVMRDRCGVLGAHAEVSYGVK